jgi:hypothetical protein
MPRFLLSVPLLLLVGTAAAFLTHPAAQVAAPLLIGAAPGIGHGFIIDKHVAAGLSCAVCHAESPPASQPESVVCTKCHGTYSQLAAKTGADEPNPHASHLGEISCMNCHHVHRASVTYCAQCHNFGMNTP